MKSDPNPNPNPNPDPIPNSTSTHKILSIAATTSALGLVYEVPLGFNPHGPRIVASSHDQADRVLGTLKDAFVDAPCFNTGEASP